MAKKKYKFNPDTLSYERVGISFKEKSTKVLAYFSSSLALALIIAVLVINAYETPKTKALRRENQRLLTQYQLMDNELGKIGTVLDELQQRDDNIYRVIFESEPIPSSVRKAGFGGTNKYSHLESLNNSELVVATARKLDKISKEAYIQSKSYDDVLNMALNKAKMLAAFTAIQPISNKD